MLEQPPKQGLLSCLNEGEGEGEKKRKEGGGGREWKISLRFYFCIFKEIGQSKRERQRGGKKRRRKEYSEVSECLQYKQIIYAALSFFLSYYFLMLV